VTIEASLGCPSLTPSHMPFLRCCPLPFLVSASRREICATFSEAVMASGMNHDPNTSLQMEGLPLSFCDTNLLSFCKTSPSSTTLCDFQLAVRRQCPYILRLSVDGSFVGRTISGVFGTIDP
jgi:hypothetical protein